jgi:hypothetical protein
VRYEKKNIQREEGWALYWTEHAKQSIKNVAESKGNWEFNCTVTCNKDKCRLTDIVKIVGCQPIMVK